MKKAMSKMLALTLAVVMVIGMMIPMAAAADPVAFKTLTLSASSLDLKVGDQPTTLAVTKAETPNHDVTDKIETVWSSDSPSIATVDPSTGAVTAVAAGDAKVTAKVSYQGTTYLYEGTVDVAVHVTEAEAPTLDLSGIASTGKVGDEIPLEAKLTGGSEALNNVTWSIVAGSDYATLSSAKLKLTAKGTVTVKATYTPATGAPITAEHTITVDELRFIVALEAKTVKMDAEEPKMTVSVTARAEADKEKAKTPTLTNWRSQDKAVATIDKDTGVLKLLKTGETEIFVNVTVDGEEHKDVHATLTVVNEGEITCAQHETSTTNTTMLLAPVLSGVHENTAVKWTFEVTEGTSTLSTDDADTTKNYTSVTVTRGNYGISVVKITAKWGNPERIAQKEVYISFYSEENYEVRLRKGVSSFTFGDTNVFSSVSNGLVNLTPPSGYSMSALLTDAVASSVTLTEGTKASTNSRVGKISYPGVTAASQSYYVPSSSNNYVLGYEESKLVFTVLGDGEFVLTYKLYDAFNDKTMVSTQGTITIKTGEAEPDIEYKTTYGESVTFDEMDFIAFWNSTGLSGSLKYVEFGVSSSVIPYFGKLYTDKGQKVEVTASMDFEPNYVSTSSNYDLDTVTYASSKSLKQAHEEVIPFTCYGTGTNPKSVSGVLVIKIGNEMPFTDVKAADWFYESVAYVYNNGIMNGTSDTLFSPSSTLTRAMVVTMLYRIEGQPATSFKSTFSDVKNGQWYSLAVEWAAKNNIVNGMGDGTFGYAKAITREQFAAILYRYADYKNMSTTGASSLTKFSDYKTVSTYAESALKWAVYEGIINGSDGKLQPRGTATRAQAAKMIHYFLEG